MDYSQYYVRGLGNQIAVIWGLGKFLNSSLELKPQYLYAIGRLLTLLYGLATIYLLYFLSLELFKDYAVSLLASLFLALSWIHVAYSHIGVADISCLFWVYAALYSILLYVDREDDLYLVLASIAGGFAIGTKFSVYIVLPLIFIVIGSRRKLYHSLLILFVLMGSFELINAFSYTPESFFNTRYMMLTDSFAGVEANKLINLPVYTLLLLSSMGLPIFLLSLRGIFSLLKTAKLRNIHFKDILTNKYVLITAPILLHFYMICRLVVNLTRYLLPLIPLLAMFAAYGLVKLFDRRSFPRVFKGIVAAIIVYQLLQIVSLEKGAVIDTRKLMGEWMEENISPNKIISTGPLEDYSIVPSIYKTTTKFDANYIALHSSFYSRYLTGVSGFKDTYPKSCDEIFHCRGGEKTRQFIQNLFQGKTNYVLLKKFELNFITPEMLLLKYLFGPRVDGYGSYTGDMAIFGKQAVVKN